MLKVLIVNTSDIEGGAARAAYRLCRALLAEGVDSQMLVQSQSSDDFAVVGPQTKVQKALGKLRPTLDFLPVRCYDGRTKTLFSPCWLPFSSIVGRINSINPDLVHLHWIAGGMIRIEDLAKIKVPVVWSLHDMWSFTGGCHYDEECGFYQGQCGTCPALASSKAQDLSRKVWRRKQKTFGKITNLNIIGLSQWLADCAKQSSLFKGASVLNLPNPIDTNTFAPFDKARARDLLNLPHDKKLILFGAMGATSDPRKGFAELSKALDRLTTLNTELVIFGASQPPKGATFSQEVHYLGRLHDDVTLRVLYSAADVMVVPSRQENLSNAIMESLACGTPVVGFSIGGNSDLIDHQVNGYLAKPFSVDDLANGIDWVLQSGDYQVLSNSARQKVTQCFDYKVVAPKYINLYRSVLEKESL